MNKNIILILIIFFSFSCNRQRTTINKSTPDEVQLEENSSNKTKSSEKDESLTFLAEVTRIIDGDTVEILYHQLYLTIRMKHIDAPETRGDQPYGEAAKKAIAKLCAGQTVTVSTEGEFDGFGRLIAELIDSNGLNINKEMVRLGFAWHFKKYSDNKSYDQLEQEAKNHNRGLWQEKKPVAPWNFR